MLNGRKEWTSVDHVAYFRGVHRCRFLQYDRSFQNQPLWKEQLLAFRKVYPSFINTLSKFDVISHICLARMGKNVRFVLSRTKDDWDMLLHHRHSGPQERAATYGARLALRKPEVFIFSPIDWYVWHQITWVALHIPLSVTSVFKSNYAPQLKAFLIKLEMFWTVGTNSLHRNFVSLSFFVPNKIFLLEMRLRLIRELSNSMWKCVYCGSNFGATAFGLQTEYRRTVFVFITHLAFRSTLKLAANSEETNHNQS